MPIQALPKLSFTAGELSPWLFGRVDTDFVSNGASCLENMLVTPFGGLKRRNGMELVDASCPLEGTIRLMPFTFSAGDQLMMEFSRGLIRYFKEGHLLTDNAGHHVTTTSPWTTDKMIRELRMQQLNDVIYIVCPDVPPYLLERYGMTDWRIGPMTFKSHPYESNLGNAATISFKNNDEHPFAELDITADRDIFAKNMEGSELLRIGLMIDESEIKYFPKPCTQVNSLNRDFMIGEHFYRVTSPGWATCYSCRQYFSTTDYKNNDDPEFYPTFFRKGVVNIFTFPVWGPWTFQTSGVWDGEWVLEKCNDDPRVTTNKNLRKWYCAKLLLQDDQHRQNYSLSGDESEEVLFRLFLTRFKIGGQLCHPEFRRAAAHYDFLYKIIKVITPRHALATFNRAAKDIELPDTNTSDWSFGAFGIKNGYPSCIAFHEGRLWMASTKNQPQTIWASGVDDLNNFSAGSTPDAPLSLTLAAAQQNKICWISSLRGLIVGTTEGEWVLKSSDNAPINVSNATFERQSGIGSSPLESLTVENSLYFIQQGQGKVREFSYSLASDGFISSDAGLLAEHILSQGLVAWAHQKAVALHIWCVLENGQIACMTVNKAQNVLAWHQHKITDGSILSVACIHGDSNWEDEVWVIAQRMINGTMQRSIERMRANSVYLDAFVTRQSSQTKLNNLGHLIGKNVLMYPTQQSGQTLEGIVASNGTLTLPTGTPDGQEWFVGIPFTSKVVTMPLETQETLGLHKNRIRAKLLLLDSNLEFEYGTGDSSEWLPFERKRHNLSDTYSGYVDLTIPPSIDKQPKLAIKTSHSGSLNILAIIPEITITN
ncbi:MAG: hypothetical protein RSB24_08555 [Akkermansia sp.]